MTTCLVSALSACGGSDDGDEKAKAPQSTPTAPATSSPPTATADPEAPEKKALLDVYRAYWEENVAASAKASLKGSRLSTYAKGNALGLVQGNIANMRAAGHRTSGKPTFEPEEVRLTLDRKVPAAQIKACIDISGWTLIDSKTKRAVPLPEQRRTRFVSNVSAEKWDSSWVILETKPQDQEC